MRKAESPAPLIKESLDRVRWHSISAMMSYRTLSNFNSERDMARSSRGSISAPSADIIPKMAVYQHQECGYTKVRRHHV